jgi:hypothetical protein
VSPDVIALSEQFEGDTPGERLFVMLVAVATAYEATIASAWTPHDRLTPRVMMVKGLVENLELNEEDK